jgi:hypothetical protein
MNYLASVLALRNDVKEWRARVWRKRSLERFDGHTR